MAVAIMTLTLDGGGQVICSIHGPCPGETLQDHLDFHAADDAFNAARDHS
jgi:hypothetical protein